MSSKRFVFVFLAVLGCQWSSLWLPSVRAASGSSDSTLDVNFFYDALKDQGSWFNTTEYGDVWQPYIAYKSDTWRPYTDGYWTYTDGGWMFVSYEDFGWAVYHYGRWTQLKDIGWAWVPGTDWSPAWVTWRESNPSNGENGQPAANVAATTTDADQPTPAPAPPTESSSSSVASSSGGGSAPAVSENYIGWAPLPPDPVGYTYTQDYSYGPSVDIDYGIDPYDYCFTDVRYFGAPYLGAVIFDPGRSYYCAERSVNVTNLYYDRHGAYRGFYNGGPRYDRFNGVTERPIPRYNLQREQGRQARAAVQAGRFNQINGNRLNVVAPRFSQKNVRNGRVNFANRGALPVTQVNRDRPAAAQANQQARERARNAFQQQGEAFRAKNPNSQSARRAAREAARQPAAGGQPGANPAGAPGITQTPRAREEERTARREARQEGDPAANPARAANPKGPGGGPGPNPGVEQAANNPAANPARAQTRTERRATEREARRQGNVAARAQRGNEANVARQQARQAARQSARASRQRASAPRVARQPRASAPRVARQPRGGGGGGRAVRAGGGGRPPGGGGHPAGGGGKRGGGGGKKH